MKTINPNSPLLTLVIEPKKDVTTRSLLAQFHPVMKSFGFGHFEMEEDGFYAANREAGSIWQTTEYVFAEIIDGNLFVNLDGRPLFFGLKKTERLLESMGQKFEKEVACVARVNGPDTGKVLLSNLMFTWIPMLLGVVTGVIMVGLIYDTKFITQVGTSYSPYFWTLVVSTSARTRFWARERRNQRPIWIGISILFFVPIALFLLVPLIDFLFSLF